jgi:intergrase/recombinase
MEAKKEPLDIIRTLKKMIKEPAYLEDVYAEVEVEPKRIRKWVSSHLAELIGGAIIPVILFVIPYMIPYIWNLIQKFL